MNERDHRLDAAWRAASSEEPPGAVDDAIRAAARREVGAGPGRSRATHWWPLAAAATVAALAVGIMQLTPPEQLVTTAHLEATPPPGSKQLTDALRGAAPSAPEPKEVASGRATVSAPSMQAETPVARAASTPAAASTRSAAKAEADHAASRQRFAVNSGGTSPPRSDAASRMEGQAGAAMAPVPAQAPMREPQAFPNAPAAAATAAPPPVQSPAAMGSSASAGHLAAMQDSARKAPTSANALAAPAEQGESPRALAKTTTVKDAPARPVDEWVALIRRLRAEGKIADAARELAAFHDAYKDRAESLLPRDLREAKP